MRQRYLMLLLIGGLIVTMALGAFVPTKPAQAQGTIWSYDYSTGNQHGSSVVAVTDGYVYTATWNGAGYTMDNNAGRTPPDEAYGSFTQPLPETAGIIQVKVWFSGTNCSAGSGSGFSYIKVKLGVDNYNSGSQGLVNVCSGSPFVISTSGASSGDVQVYGYNFTDHGPQPTLSISRIDVYPSTITPTPTFTPTPTTTPGTPTPTPEPSTAWPQPIINADRAESDFPATDIINPPFVAIYNGDVPALSPATETGALIAYSNRVGANVHNLQGGIVSSVQRLASQCSTLGGSAPAYSCRAVVYTRNADLTIVGDLMTRIRRDDYLDYSEAWVITVSVPEWGTFYYVVGSPKVQAGQTVSRGCILGVTLKFYPDLPRQFGANKTPATEGYTVIVVKDNDNHAIYFRPYLISEPQNISCTYQTGLSTTCKLVYNPTFENNGEGWVLATDPSRPNNLPHNPPGQNSGLTLEGSGSATQRSINLDASKEYIVTVVNHVQSPITTYPVYWVQLGTGDPMVVAVDGTTSSTQTTSFPAAVYTPGSDGLFDLSITRPGIGPADGLIIDFVCISDPDEPPPAPAGGCLLYNPEFDAILPDTRIWTLVSSAHGTPEIDGGIVTIADQAGVTQSLTLSPKASGSQSYTLTVIGRRKGAPATGESTSVDWSWDSQSGTMTAFSDQNFRTVTATISVSTKTTADLSIAANGSTSTQVMEIDSVCVTTSDGVAPPGYQDQIIVSTCKVCSFSPVGNADVDILEVARWIICVITQIWNCQAKQILMGIWQALINLIAFMGFLRIWLAGTMTAGVAWTNSNLQVFAQYLNALISNLGTQIQNAISYGPSNTTFVSQTGGNGIFDWLISIANLVGQIVTGIVSAIHDLRDVLLSLLDKLFFLLVTVITIVLSLLSLLMAFLTSLFTTLMTLFSLLITALTSGFTGATLPPELTFENKTGALYYLGIILYLSDQYIFSNATVALIVNVVIGLFSFDLLTWALEEFSGTLRG